eukprot:707732-Prorocentrum_minimum.AAC.3
MAMSTCSHLSLRVAAPRVAGAREASRCRHASASARVSGGHDARAVSLRSSEFTHRMGVIALSRCTLLKRYADDSSCSPGR